MSTPVNETYYLKMNSGQVIGPLKMVAIEAMLRASNIDDSVQVSTDQRTWVRLSLLLDGTAEGIPLSDVVLEGEEPLWDFGSVGEQAEDEANLMSEPLMEELTYLPGKPAPMPGRSVSEFAAQTDAPFSMDIPLPGRASGQNQTVDLPGLAAGQPTEMPIRRSAIEPLKPPPNSKFADIPMPGVSAPLPGLGAPLPGRGAPLPGAQVPLPGATNPLPGISNPMPGRANPAPGRVNPLPGMGPGDTSLNADSNVPLEFPPSVLRESPGFQRDKEFGSERNQFGSHHAPTNELNPNRGGTATRSMLGGAGRDPAALGDLGYEVDDLFAAGSEKNSLFSASADPDARPKTLMGTPALLTQPGGPGEWKEKELNQNHFGARQFGLDSSVDAIPEFELEDDVEQNLVYSKYTDPDNVAEMSATGAIGLPAGDSSSVVSEVEPVKRKSGSSKLTLVLLIILLVVCAGAGVYFYLETRPNVDPSTIPAVAANTNANANKAPTAPPVDPETVKDKDLLQVLAGGPEAHSLSLQAIGYDNFRDYERLAKTAETQKSDPMSLLVKSIIRSRYPGSVDEEGVSKIAAQYASASGGLEALARGAWDASGGAADAARSYFEQVEDSDPAQDYYVYALGGVGDVVALRDYLDSSPDEIDESRVDGYAQSARRALNQAVKKDPNLPFAYFWLGQLAELVGDPAVAINNYKRALNAQAYHVGSVARLGKSYVYAGQLKEAKEYADKLINELEPVAHPSELSTAYEVLGDVEFFQNNWKASINALKKAIEVDPMNTSAIEALADVFEYTDSSQEAINFFTVAPFLKRDTAAVMLATARAEIGIGRTTDAKTLLMEGEKKFPNNVSFPLELGWLYESESNFTGAQAAYRRALEMNPRLSAARISLARITWRNANDHAETDKILNPEEPFDSKEIPYKVAFDVGVYYLNTNQLEKAKEWFLKALQIAPTYTAARVLLVDALIAEGKYDQALITISNASNADTDLALITAKAKVLAAKDEVAGAKQLIDKVLEEDEGYSEALVILAKIATEEGDFEVAEKALKDATKTVGDVYIEKSIAKGLLSQARQDYDQAKINFETLLRLRPSARASNYYLGDVYNELGNRSKAQEMYSKYIEASSFRVPLSAAYLKRGELFFQNGIYRMAEADYEEALKSSQITPLERCRALTGISDVAMKQKKFARAIEYLQLALETGVEVPRTHMLLGKAYANAGDSANAVKQFSIAKELGLEDPEIDRLRGYAFKEQGRSADARAAFTEYLKTLNPAKQSAEIKEILRQIDTL